MDALERMMKPEDGNEGEGKGAYAGGSGQTTLLEKLMSLTAEFSVLSRETRREAAA